MIPTSGFGTFRTLSAVRLLVRKAYQGGSPPTLAELQMFGGVTITAKGAAALAGSRH